MPTLVFGAQVDCSNLTLLLQNFGLCKSPKHRGELEETRTWTSRREQLVSILKKVHNITHT